MRVAGKVLLVALAGWVVLVVGTHSFASSRVSCTSGNCAGVTMWSGGNNYSLSPGSCQSAGGDFSLAIAGQGYYFHLLRTPKGHGNYHSVVWRSDREGGTVLGAKIEIGKDAAGRTIGTFSGRTTKGVRTTGTFTCG